MKAVLRVKRLKSTENHFADEPPKSQLADALKTLAATFFNVADRTTEALKDRFETLGDVRAGFGALLSCLCLWPQQRGASQS